jgi:hypothetical protein
VTPESADSTSAITALSGSIVQNWDSLVYERTVLCMTLDEAREEVIAGIDYAAYRETDSSLHDADKNRLFGSEHYRSGRPVYNLVRGQTGILKTR